MPEPLRIAWALAGGAVAVALVAGVALASRTEIGAPAAGSELRLALRAAHARLEICRERSAEELAELPAHFRVRKECEEVAVDYRLTLAVDGEPRLERMVSHSGVRRTRPLAVDERIALPAGRHQVELAFVPEPPAELQEEDDEHESGEDEPLRAAYEALPAPRFSESIDFAAGRAELLMLDESGVVRRAGADARR